MRGKRRATRDIIVSLVCIVLVFGLIGLGVGAAIRFPHLYADLIAWRWRIALGMVVLPFTILGFASVAFLIIGRLTRPRDRGPIS